MRLRLNSEESKTSERSRRLKRNVRSRPKRRKSSLRPRANTLLLVKMVVTLAVGQRVSPSLLKERKHLQLSEKKEMEERETLHLL